MTRLAAEQCGGRNVAAFMDMLAFAEGTDNGRQKTNDHGYDVQVGGNLLTDYATHPREPVYLPRYGITSTAAGRYQFTAHTWDEMAARLALPDFGPVSQDRACVQLLRRCGAYPLIRAGQFDDAVHMARKTWASLPGAGYGQREQRIEALRVVYRRAGGVIGRPA